MEVHTPCDSKIILSYGGLYFGYSVEKKSPVGIGADDKNGIWVALKMLLKFKALKVAFFVGEEIGCVGSSKADMTFFENARFVIQCDRKGGSDFINIANSTELCSNEFINAIGIENFGYKKANGFTTDVYKLKTKGLKVCCVNLSCGYYNPHTEKECTVIDELRNCRNLVEHIIRNLTEVWPHEYKPSYGGYSGGYSGYYNNYSGGGGSHNAGFSGSKQQNSGTNSGSSVDYVLKEAIEAEKYCVEGMIDDYLCDAPCEAYDAWKFWKNVQDMFDYISYEDVSKIFKTRVVEYEKSKLL